MEVRFTLQAVAHVPIYYWPWVWWQLYRLRQQCRAARCEVLWEVDEHGFVYVPFVSDLETDLLAWFYKEVRKTRAHWAPMDNASGEMHLSAIHYLTGRLMECGERCLPGLVIDAECAAPAIQDSS
ncbi:MAG: hypothetical protein QNI84_03160 [Henriciella sp.]|nr:hypothetical protein [Henriciella sp.]